MSDKWICKCGKENDGQFCIICGSPRPAEPPAAETPQAAPAPKFDIYTGEPLQPEASAAETPPAPAPKFDIYTGEPIPPETLAAEVPPKKKSFRPLLIAIIAAAVVAVAVVLIILLSEQYKVNKYVAEKDKAPTVQAGYYVLPSSEQDLSFQYPGTLIAESTSEGDFIYADGRDTYPFVRIQRTEGKTTPRKYFKQYKKQMLEQYPTLEFSEIYEVDIENKTLYMIRTHIPDEGTDVEQYLEIYKNYYITYNSVGYEAGTPNTELYYAIRTLRPSALAYGEEAVAKSRTFENEMGNYSVVIPANYQVSEFTSGVYLQGEKSSLFASYFNTDPQGAMIYDRDDFITRAGAVDGYIAALLGVESAEFSEGEEETINGTDFLRCPVSIVYKDGTSAEGAFYVADTENFGVYCICYYLEPDAGTKQEEEADAFIQSMTVNGAPNVAPYVIFDLRDKDLGMFAVRAELLGDLDPGDESIWFYDPEKEETVALELLSNTTMKDTVNREALRISKMDEHARLYDLNVADMGRYEFEAVHYDYKDNKNAPRTMELYGLSDGGGNLILIDFDVNESNADWAKEVAQDLIWSWRQY